MCPPCTSLREEEIQFAETHVEGPGLLVWIPDSGRRGQVTHVLKPLISGCCARDRPSSSRLEAYPPIRICIVPAQKLGPDPDPMTCPRGCSAPLQLSTIETRDHWVLRRHRFFGYNEPRNIVPSLESALFLCLSRLSREVRPRM